LHYAASRNDHGGYDVGWYPAADVKTPSCIAITVNNPVGADITTRVLTSVYQAGGSGQILGHAEIERIADSLGFMITPWGGTSDRGLRTEVALAYETGWKTAHPGEHAA
jgi:hypothetical protein